MLGQVVDADAGLAGSVEPGFLDGGVLSGPRRRERSVALCFEILDPRLPGSVCDPESVDEDDVGHVRFLSRVPIL